MDLRATQAALQARILTGDDAVAALIDDDERTSRNERLGIYAFAYSARLVESLQQTYPAVLHVLGADAFSQMAHAYIAGNPSRVASIRYYGRTFAGFLERELSEPGGLMLGDLARWEWALTCAFDGADADALPIDASAEVAPEQWPALRLQLPMSLQRTSHRTNATAWWRFAVQDAAQPDTITTTAMTEWVIWRTGLQTSFRSLPPDEAWMLDTALRGEPFADLCAGLANFTGEAAAAPRAASLLKSWWLGGWVTGFHYGRETVCMPAALSP
jgi:hypothetical protein